MNLQNYTAKLTYKPLKAETSPFALSYSKRLQLLITQLALIVTKRWQLILQLSLAFWVKQPVNQEVTSRSTDRKGMNSKLTTNQMKFYLEF